MLNIVSLVNYLRNNPHDSKYIIDQLCINFYTNISDKEGKVILGSPYLFVDAVNQTMKYMYMICNSVKNVDCNIIWLSVFNKIRNIGLTYYVFILNPKFLELEFRYSKKKVIVAGIQDEAVLFMGLKQHFTKEDLIQRYKTLAIKLHPDKGGRSGDFQRLQIYKEHLERRFH